MPLSTYLLRLICISGAFSLSTSPLRSQNLRKDIPTASMGSIGYTVCTVTSMRDCTEVSDSHAGTNKGCQIFFSCGFSKGLEANKLLSRFEKRSGICFFCNTNGLQSVTAESSQTRVITGASVSTNMTRRFGPNGCICLALDALGDAHKYIFVRYVFCLLSLCTLTLARHGNQNRSLSEKRQKFCVIQLFAMLRSSILRTQFVPDHLGCNQNLVARLWSQTLLS